MLSRSLRLSLAGIVLGLTLAAVLAPNLNDLLFKTSPHQPLVYVMTALVVLAISLLASLLPTYRTSQTNPSATLKAE